MADSSPIAEHKSHKKKHKAEKKHKKSKKKDRGEEDLLGLGEVLEEEEEKQVVKLSKGRVINIHQLSIKKIVIIQIFFYLK